MDNNESLEILEIPLVEENILICYSCGSNYMVLEFTGEEGSQNLFCPFCGMNRKKNFIEDEEDCEASFDYNVAIR